MAKFKKSAHSGSKSESPYLAAWRERFEHTCARSAATELRQVLDGALALDSELPLAARLMRTAYPGAPRVLITDSMLRSRDGLDQPPILREYFNRRRSNRTVPSCPLLPEAAIAAAKWWIRGALPSAEESIDELGDLACSMCVLYRQIERVESTQRPLSSVCAGFDGRYALAWGTGIRAARLLIACRSLNPKGVLTDLRLAPMASFQLGPAPFTRQLVIPPSKFRTAPSIAKPQLYSDPATMRGPGVYSLAPADLNNLEVAAQDCLNGGTTIMDAYRRMLARAYARTDAEGQLVALPLGQRPTLRQFRTHIRRSSDPKRASGAEWLGRRPNS